MTIKDITSGTNAATFTNKVRLEHLREDLVDIRSEVHRLFADTDPIMPRRKDMLLTIGIVKDECERWSSELDKLKSYSPPDEIARVEEGVALLTGAVDQLKEHVLKELEKIDEKDSIDD